MNKEERISSFKRIIYKSTFLTAYSVSIGACSGFGTGNMILSSVLASLFLVITPETSAFPMLLDFLIGLFIYNIAGLQGAVISFTISVITMLIIRKSGKISELLNKDYIRAALSVSTAFTMTILITTLYFGIGSSGNTVIEMIKSYRSLGFHPNWRGILYGTIVMVIMITFPRKFKNAGKTVSPEFIAIITTFLLNLWLMPQGSVEVITLLKKAEYTFLPAAADNFSSISPIKYVVILLSGISIGLVSIMADNDLRCKKLRDISIYNLPAIYTGFIIPGNVRITKRDFIEGVISAAIIIAVALPLHGFERLPLSSCAVVLIVSAWHNVNWSGIPKSFKNIRTALSFVIITAVTILVTPAAGVITAFVSSMIIYGDNKSEI